MFSIGIVKVDQGKALVRSHVMNGKVEVSFTGGIIFPVWHKAEIIDISVQTLVVERKGSEAVTCRDGVLADLKATFFIKVNQDQEDILRVARFIGCERASEPETLSALFGSKFSEALETTAIRMDFAELQTRRPEFREELLVAIGTDLGGYSLEDCTITEVRRTATNPGEARTVDQD